MDEMDEYFHNPFTSLPDEVLLHIIMFCDVQSIGRLRSTCSRFNDLITNTESLWRYKSKFILGSNMKHSDMCKRTKPIWNVLDRFKISKNWKLGISVMTTHSRYERCLPWMKLEADYLYVSRGRIMERAYRNTKEGRVYANPLKIDFSHLNADISKFALLEKRAVIGFTHGALLRCHKLGYMDNYECFKAHDGAILCVDAKNDLIVTGSRDGTIKIWKTANRVTVLKKKIPMNIRVLSIAIMPSNSYFIAGMAGLNNVHPLQQFDFESGKHITNFSEDFRHGAGILDIYPEDENTFLSCGYDTTIQLWDLRCPKTCVKKWTDPYDNGIYCVCSDHNVTITSGANRNGTILIWDKRSSYCKHMFQVHNINSPVYSIAFDASKLFASLDTGVVQFSFTNGIF